MSKYELKLTVEADGGFFKSLIATLRLRILSPHFIMTRLDFGFSIF